MRSRPRGHGEARAASSRVSPTPGRPGEVPSDAAVKPSAGSGPAARGGWPGWARVVVSLALLYHMAAVLAGAVGVPPSSELEQAIADQFTPYFDLMDLGYSYRFYAEPPPTPVVTATLQFGDGRPEETVRLPGAMWPARGCGTSGSWPWPIRCNSDVQEARRHHQGRQPEPVGPRLCPPPVSYPARLPERDPARAAALDPRPGAGAQGDGRARRAAIRPLR